MKRLLLHITAIASLLLLPFTAVADPADPSPFTRTQPDGSSITLTLHGDEYYSYLTDSDGHVVELGEDGYYHIARSIRPSAFARMQREQQEARYISAKAITTGSPRYLVILVEFSDLKFVIPQAQTAFSNLLNQEGYSANGGTGSVHDYYYQNSGGLFSPIFDVIGPVTLDKSYVYYGRQVISDGNTKHDEHASEALYDACEIINAQGNVDFSKYDNDRDGYVDGVFFFFAGYAQSHGGGDDTIWPHASYLSSFNARYNGVRVYRYACAAELTGSSGGVMCSIGTFCHEYGHTLGLPDWYDTDHATNGTASHPGSFSLMASGNYNNSSATPPALSAMEKLMLGWKEIPTLSGNGAKELGPVFSGSGLVVASHNTDEYFILESRGGGNIWDSFIPSGMLIYHVDKSQNYISAADRTAASLWNSKINCYADHPCYYFLRPEGAAASNASTVFPGQSGATYFNNLIAWDGSHSGVYLSDISHDSSTGTASFTVESGTVRRVFGTVSDRSGAPLAGVCVAVAAEASIQALERRHNNDSQSHKEEVLEIEDAPSVSGNYVVTDAGGNYSVELSEGGSALRVYASKEGYYNACSEVFSLSAGLSRQDIILSPLDYTPTTSELKKYTSGSSSISNLGYASGGAMGAVGFTAEELIQYTGDTLSAVSFRYGGGTPDSVHLLVDIGGKRVLCEEIKGTQPKTFNTVDIKHHCIVIPSGADLYIGYAVFKTPVEEEGTNFCITFNKNTHVDGSFYYSTYDLDNVKWTDGAANKYPTGNILISASLAPFDPAATEPQFPGQETPLGKAGYNTIDAPASCSDGEMLKLKLNISSKRTPSSTSWEFNGEPCTASSVTVHAGESTIKAVLHFADGSTETLIKEILVR